MLDHRRSRVLGVGLAITLGGVACRDVAEDPAAGRLAGLADYIRASMADWDLPGLAVAVVYEDEVVFAEGFGVKELGRDDPVDAHTLFQIGSVTKSFRAAAIGALVDDGLVGRDDPVVEHLPWFRVKDPEITRQMTIRDLLFADDTSGTYALGWSRTTFEGHPYLSHGGGIFGFPAYVALLPDIAAGVVVLANGRTRRETSRSPRRCATTTTTGTTVSRSGTATPTGWKPTPSVPSWSAMTSASSSATPTRPPHRSTRLVARACRARAATTAAAPWSASWTSCTPGTPTGR